MGQCMNVLTAGLIGAGPHFRPEEGETSTAEIRFLSRCELDVCRWQPGGTCTEVNRGLWKIKGPGAITLHSTDSADIITFRYHCCVTVKPCSVYPEA